MGYWAGIDLGTTFTAAAVSSGDRPKMISLSSISTSMPSVVALKADGTWLVGQAAAQRANTDPDRVAREFKRRIGDPVPILVAGTPFPASDLSTVLLSSVLDLIEQRVGSAPDGIAVTHPAGWGPYRLDVFRASIKSVSPYPVKFVAEPLAAAVHYTSRERIAEGQMVCVYDLGGGTFDTAILRRTPDGFEIVGEPLGMDRFGGIDLDATLFELVTADLPKDLSEMDTEDPAIEAGLIALRRQIPAAKIALSSDTDTSVAVSLPGYATTVRVNRAEFESAIRPRLEQTADVTADMIARSGFTPADMDRILLVGGSSRIPLVAQLLAEKLGRPISVDADPKHAIVLGAVRYATASEGPVEVPVSPPESTRPTPVVPDEPSSAPTIGALFSDLPTGPPPAGELPFGRKRPPSPGEAVPPPVGDPVSTPSGATPAPPATPPLPASAPPPVAPPAPPPTPSPMATPAPGPVPPAATPAADAASPAEVVAPKKSRKGAIVMIGLLVLVLVGAGAAFQLLRDRGDEGVGPTTTEAPVATTDADAAPEPTEAVTTTSPPVEADPPEILLTVGVGDKPWMPAITANRVYIPVSASDRVVILDSATGEVLGEVPVGDRPGAPVAAEGFVWVPNWSGNTVSMLNVATNQVDATIPVGTTPVTPLFADGSIWVANHSSNNVTVIDPSTGTVTGTVPVGTRPVVPAFGAGAVWVPGRDTNDITVIDTAGLSTLTIPVGSSPVTPLAALDRIWVPNFEGDSVTVIDAASRTVVATIGTGLGPVTPAEADGLIWVPNRRSDTLSVIDPDSLEVVAVLEVGSKPGTPSVAKGRLWVPNFGGNDVTIIDVRSQFVVGTMPVGQGPDTPVLDDNNQLWVIANEEGTATVVKPG